MLAVPQMLNELALNDNVEIEWWNETNNEMSNEINY